jgi:hypothetical protein
MPFPFKLGADPEFTVLLGNKKADASSVMRALLKGDYDESNMGYDVGRKVNIGWDGCSSTGELRPRASADPQDIVTDIETAFKAVTKKVGIFDYITHSKRAPIGGHIHLDIEKGLSTEKQNLIHRCLSSFYLPIMLGDDIASLNVRSGGSYGQMHDYRIENLTSEITTYEFRVPSAEWITTPKIAKATLAYIGTVYNEIRKDPNAFYKKYSDFIWRTLEQGDAMQKLFLSEYTAPLGQLIKDVRSAVRSFEFYPEYKEEIEYLFRPDRVIKDKKAVNYNVIEGWGLEVTKPTKRDITASKLAGKKTTGLDFDAFAPSIYVPYNDDTNVSVFSTELKKRIIALGWKLKNQYFLFGLKRGVKDFIAFDKSSQIIYEGGQIKTKSDVSAISNIIERISPRFQYDPTLRTAKEKTAASPSYVIVGIPYEMRIENKTKAFVEFIYDLEQKKYEPLTFAPEILANSERGELANIYDPIEDSKHQDSPIEMEDDNIAAIMAQRYLDASHRPSDLEAALKAVTNFKK